MIRAWGRGWVRTGGVLTSCRLCHGGTRVVAPAGPLPGGPVCVSLRTEQLFAGQEAEPLRQARNVLVCTFEIKSRNRRLLRLI